MLAEVAERRGLDAVEPVPEVHLVEVHPEDLVFAELTLEPRRDEDLGELAAKCLVGCEETLTGQLLRERAAALGKTAFEDVVQRRAGDTHDIDPAMVVEPLILDGQDRLHELWGDLRQRDVNALLAKDGKGLTIARVEDRRRLRHRADAAQGLAIRNLADDASDEPDAGDEHGRGDRCGGQCEPAMRTIQRHELRAIESDQPVVELDQPGSNLHTPHSPTTPIDPSV